MLRIIFRVCILLGVAFAFSLLIGVITSTARAAGLTDLVYVPQERKHQDSVQVPVEVVAVFPKQQAAYQKIEAFRGLLIKRGMTVPSDWSERPFLGKCIVSPTKYADLRVECVSFAMWQGDSPFSLIQVSATAQEALAVIDEFLARHRERVLRPRPGSGPTLMT